MVNILQIFVQGQKQVVGTFPMEGPLVVCAYGITRYGADGVMGDSKSFSDLLGKDCGRNVAGHFRSD